MVKSYTLQLTGRVQNVGFRYFTIQEAIKEGLGGYVRNVSNGSVNIEVEGEEEAVARFLMRVRKGPSWSRVDNVTVQEQPLRHFKKFSAKY